MPKALGIRLQIVLALSWLLALAFVPLYVAVASLTGASMQSVREASARRIGRALAAQIEEARTGRSPSELEALIDAEIGAGGVTALAVYDQRGLAIHQGGDPRAQSALPKTVAPGPEKTVRVATSYGPAALALIPAPRGAVTRAFRA